jgi:hypothetical protein
MVKSMAPVAAAAVAQFTDLAGVDLEEQPGEQQQQPALAQRLEAWAAQLVCLVPHQQQQQRSAPAPSARGAAPLAASLPAHWWQHQALTVLELFGGLCAGLEACLRNGLVVQRYVYVDRDPHSHLPGAWGGGVPAGAAVSAVSCAVATCGVRSSLQHVAAGRVQHHPAAL